MANTNTNKQLYRQAELTLMRWSAAWSGQGENAFAARFFGPTVFDSRMHIMHLQQRGSAIP